MTSREIAQWMREEHDMVEELSRNLRDQVATIPRTGLKPWIIRVTEQLDQFKNHLLKHFDLEQTGGYLEAVTQRSPGLAPEVDRLEHEHDEIGRILTSLHADMGNVTEQDHILLEDCCARVQNLLRYLKDHEERENLMILSVFTSDLGTKD